MGKTILVTGGAGYIGSFTVKELLNQGYEVLVIDSLENGHREAVDKRANLEVVDLVDSDKVKKVFEQYVIEAVIDFAAYLAVGESMDEPKKYMDNNVGNFIKLLDVIVQSGVKYIIKSSTASTYGNPPDDKYFPLQENYQEIFRSGQSALLEGRWAGKTIEKEAFFQQLMMYYDEIIKNHSSLKLTDVEMFQLRIPASVYGLTKMFDEIIMKKYEKEFGLKSVALRYFNVCGAAEDGSIGEDKPKPTTLMTLCFWNIIGRTEQLKVFGTDYPTKDGTGIRDYIHPLDLAAGHVSALKYLTETDQSNTFNLGRGEGYSVFEVMKAVETISRQKIKYEVVGRRSGDPAVSYADPAKAEKILGWTAKYNLTDMAETAWKWHLTHPAGYQN